MEKSWAELMAASSVLRKAAMSAALKDCLRVVHWAAMWDAPMAVH